MNDVERWQHVKALFLEALERTPEEQDAFLNAACADDPAMRTQVQALLDADASEHGGVLDEPVLSGLASTMPAHDPDLGAQVGAYRLIRLLGQGGMGNVYLAERTDGAFQQHVALKLIRRGLDTDDILARFHYERQILAWLDHPHIATLHDGGVTEDGRPYFVMEYVDGEPITDYCDRHRLPMPQRLALFRTGCRAVAYAHRNLVVHRDLKPSNILVTRDGTVKLLDFGIAKLMDDEEMTRLALTHTGQRLLTPEYASPEQVRGEAITTATDVYQLGVLLYELLTGRRPYQIEKHVRWAIEWAILEDEPPRPSTAVRDTTTTRRVDSETISTARATRPVDLARSLSGDLDTICLTALQKDPDRRYASVEQFGDDVRRHLAGLPITARADSAVYRLGRFIRRHRVAVAASVLVLVLVLGGGVLYTVRIQAERDRAERALRQSESALGFLRDMILAGDPIDGDPDTPIGVVLDSAAARVDAVLGEEPEVARTIHAALGYVYLSLDRAEPGEHHLRQALTLRSEETSAENVARTLVNLTTLLANQGRFDEAEAYNQEALQLLRSLEGTEADLAAALDSYGTMLSNSGRDEEAIPLYQEALQQYRVHNHPDTAITLNNLAVSYAQTGALDRAMDTQRRAIAAYRQNQAPPVRIGIALAVLASLYGNAGQRDSALATQARAVTLLREALGDEHLDTITARVSLALHHYRNGTLEAALREAQPALDDALQALGPDSPYTAYAQEVTGAILCDLDQPDEGAPLVQQSLATRQAFLPEDHPMLFSGSSLLGGCLMQAGRLTEAEPLLTQSYQQLLDGSGPDDAMTQRARDRLRRFYEATGRTEEAAQLAHDD